MDVELELMKKDIERLKSDNRMLRLKVSSLLPFLTRLQHDLGSGNWVVNGATKMIALFTT
jgi:hypothetical protein